MKQLSKLFLIAISIYSCGGPKASESSAAEVVVVKEMVSCRALWLCRGSVNPAGYVTSSRNYDTNSREACLGDLQRQVGKMGQCIEGEYLDLSSLEHFYNNVEIKLLTVNSNNGSRLKRLLDQLKDMLDDGCDGSVCTETYWNDLGRGYESMKKWDDYLIEKEMVLSKPLLDRAIILAARMCQIDHRGSKKWVDFLWDKTFIAGAALISMQRNAGFSPVQCPRLVGQRPGSK